MSRRRVRYGNTIATGTTWNNRNNGRKVTVSATLTRDGVEVVRIADNSGREIEVPREFFHDTYELVEYSDEPYAGETWSIGYTQVTIVTVSDGFVVYRNPSKACAVQAMEMFLDMAKPGIVERPLPDVEGGRGRMAYFPVWERRGEAASENGWLRTDQLFKTPEAIVAEKPYHCLGIVGVPLDWDKMEWVEWPKEARG